MEQYILAFIAGLTTGGLSCLAVQGGLLATSLERQVEQNMLLAHGKKLSQAQRQRARQSLAFPIFLFLAAKLVAYTLLGALLGALGSVFQLNTTLRAILLIGIGIFMLGNALRMFNVHPIFRYFAVEPPQFITRYIRRTARAGEEYVTPLLLGALTVFIPCGVTQATMALAIGTGSAAQGAMLMFAFTLGTSPVFFAVSYMATQLGSLMEKWFMRFVAVVVLVVGLVSVDSGLTLIGFPYSGANLYQAYFSPAPAPQAASPSGELDSTLTLAARNDGYFPTKLAAKAGVPITLNIVTDNTTSCARDFVIPELDVNRLLPRTGTVTVDIPAHVAGYKMFFTCSMGMYTGVIEFR